MKKILTIAMGVAAMAANAQETYEGAAIATQDLNGTAKYVGMGGAMEALGADISTINTNPAGMGLFRRSWIGVSAGFTAQNGSFDGLNNQAELGSNSKTNADFNQIGFVWSSKAGKNSYLNLGFNFQKSRNFNQIMQAVNSLPVNGYGSSATKMDAMKLYSGSPSYTLQDEIIEAVISTPLGGTKDDPVYSAAETYDAKYDNEGYIGNYDFNISGNIHDRVYLGLTLGVKDVHYDSRNIYKESLIDATNYPRGTFGFTDDRRITGTGFDLKIGAIFRPVEDSPFRFGLYINTPTWYELTCSSNMSAAAGMNDHGISYNENGASSWFRYKYCLYTPWRFGVSVGHTFGKKVAIGATYEYADYSAIKNRIVEGTYINYYGDESLQTSKDYQMNSNTEQALKGVSLLKLGMEIKPVPELAIRIGYNYQSAIYNKEGFKSPSIDTDVSYGSVGAYYSTYDYVNWEGTNRLTLGLGFNLGKQWGLDLSYQYATQKGTYYPFVSGLADYRYTYEDQSYDDIHEENIATATTVHNNRHQFNMTLGYRF